MHDVNLFYGAAGLVTSTAGGYYIFTCFLAAQAVSFTEMLPFHKVIGFRRLSLDVTTRQIFFRTD